MANKCSVCSSPIGYRSQTGMCKRCYYKAYYEANHEKANAATRRWQRDNPDKMKAITRKWRHNHPDKAREYQRERRTYLSAYIDCEKLNPVFPWCDFHHLTPDTGVHIPASLHRSVSHNMKTCEGMEEINALAMDWLNGVRSESPQTTLDAFG